MLHKYFNITIVWVAMVFFLTGCEEKVSTKGNAVSWITMPSVEEHSIDPQENNGSKVTEVDPPGAYLSGGSPSNWYIRLVAEDVTRGLRSANTQLGEIDADDAVAEHTLKAIRAFDRNYLDVVFQNPDDVGAGDYKSSFHRYDDEAVQRWRFTVRSSDVNADITLHWRGPYVLSAYTDDQLRTRYYEHTDDNLSLAQRMKLIDLKTGQEMAVITNDSRVSYPFNMEGAYERQFEWVVATMPVVNQSGLQDVVTSASVVQQRSYPHNIKPHFDLSKPPETGVHHFNE